MAPKTDSMHFIPFNPFNSSHASYSLFHLPTHNSTYHLAATTRDSRTNLGFKTLALEELEEHLTKISKSISFARFNHKNGLGIVGAPYLEDFHGCLLLEKTQKIERKREEEAGHERRK